MKIVSCGTSFSSLEPKRLGTHYSEILAREINAELVNIAKPGSSNFAIRLQIDTAIAMNPDLITFEFANASRIDLPLSAFNENGRYDKRNLAHNLRYTNYESVVDPSIDLQSESIISDGIRNLIDGECFPVNEQMSSNARKALEYWFTELYDEDLKYHQDYYICQSAFFALEQSGIPYIWTCGDLCMFDWKTCKNQVADGGNPWLYKIDPTVDNVYHTTTPEQAIIATHWIEAYSKLRL